MRRSILVIAIISVLGLAVSSCGEDELKINNAEIENLENTDGEDDEDAPGQKG